MKRQDQVVLVVVFAACLVGVGLPFIVSGVTRQDLLDPNLTIPNTRESSPTPTFSTERALTREEFSRLFFTPTFPPTGIAAFTPLSVSTDIVTAPAPPATFTATPRPGLFSFLFPTRTKSPDLTATPTFTRTPTRTPSRTPTFTRTLTPSLTPSLTASVTPSQTASVTPSQTASVTPSQTASVTPSQTASVTPSQIPPTNTPTQTVSITPLPTDTPVPPTNTPVPPTDTPTPGDTP